MQQKTGVSNEHNPDRRKPDHHIFKGIPESAGRRLATFKGGVMHAIRPPGSHTVLSSCHLAKVMLAPSPGVEVARGSDKLQSYDASVGMVLVNPAGRECRARWSSTQEYVVIAIEPEYLLELAAHELDLGNVELQSPPSGTVDPHALHLAKLIRAELTRNGSASELYIDSLITIFGIHLLRNYAGGRKPMPTVRGGLSVRGAQRVQECLDANFSRKLSVAELSAVSGLAPGHFIQAFTKTFGEPPHRHMIKLRLDFAERLLIDGNMTIAEVAHLSGFSSQSHLTATMGKYRRGTPAQLRRNG
jgi:AraC family transcriptional regulator